MTMHKIGNIISMLSFYFPVFNRKLMNFKIENIQYSDEENGSFVLSFFERDHKSTTTARETTRKHYTVKYSTQSRYQFKGNTQTTYNISIQPFQ